jgi:hypothetical protein
MSGYRWWVILKLIEGVLPAIRLSLRAKSFVLETLFLRRPGWRRGPPPLRDVHRVANQLGEAFFGGDPILQLTSAIPRDDAKVPVGIDARLQLLLNPRLLTLVERPRALEIPEKLYPR